MSDTHKDAESVFAPIVEVDQASKEPDSFSDEMKIDPSVRKCGKFHIGSKTFWWILSYDGFASTLVSDEVGSLAITRKTHFEFTTVYEGSRVLRRITLWKLLIQFA